MRRVNLDAVKAAKFSANRRIETAFNSNIKKEFFIDRKSSAVLRLNRSRYNLARRRTFSAFIITFAPCLSRKA